MAAILKYLLRDIYFLGWAGLFVWMILTRRRVRRFWRIIGFWAVISWLIATRPAAELALMPLERAYPVPNLIGLYNSGIEDVVVLSGGGGRNWYNPLASQALNESSLSRLMAGLELCVLLDGHVQLIVTGAGRDNTAGDMARLSWTIRPELPIAVDSTARRTWDHPKGVRPYLRSERLILVTSASHLPRAVSVFRRAGLKPVPYPADYRYPAAYRAEDFIPSTQHLVNLEAALYEYLGRVLYVFL